MKKDAGKMEEGTENFQLPPKDTKTEGQAPSQLPPPPQPYQTYPQPYYYNVYPGYYYGKRPGYKKFFGIPSWIWLIILLIILLISCGIIDLLTDWDFYDRDEISEKYSTVILISEGGHFRFDLGYIYSEEKVKLDIFSKDRKTFDIYIMDLGQYENAYDTQNSSIIAFSTTFAKENIDQIDETIKLYRFRSYPWGQYNLVIDNRNTTLTPNDAIPDGMITVDMNVTMLG
ncbi:MAG: hypothetical protein JSV56_09790 [Methanomassiliicoccales archaeon]|nr:MAG: hypothetical protein JSV56_09790 [Methanomassiliicoccales archaeon]